MRKSPILFIRGGSRDGPFAGPAPEVRLRTNLLCIDALKASEPRPIRDATHQPPPTPLPVSGAFEAQGPIVRTVPSPLSATSHHWMVPHRQNLMKLETAASVYKG
ncbi:hypothetical protein FDECE_13390 [Fusarium decemcellulare]|nr:hypothetical protein FDECE_13390 [Fusarium decemcellulare]